MNRSIFKTDNTLPLLILRICLAVVILPHGHYRFRQRMDHLTRDYGLLWILALLVVLIEFFAPLFYSSGCQQDNGGFYCHDYGRCYTFHWSNGFFMSWFGTQAGEGFEFHVLAIGMALVIVIKGGGKYSIDGMLDRESEAQKSRIKT